MHRPAANSLIALALLISGCTAPRDNPYDPDAANYIGPTAGSVSGRVTSYTGLGLAGAEITAVPTSPGLIRGSFSNSSGYYSIPDVPAGGYALQCLLDGHAPAQTNISVGEGGTLSGKNFTLNALPLIQSFNVTSQYVNTNVLPFLYYSITAHATLTLPDGVNDIDSVLLQTQLGLQWVMNFETQAADSFYYSVSLNQSSLPGGSVNGIVGHYFLCTILDTAEATVQSEPATIMRFLSEPLYTYSPGYNIVVFDTAAWLTWDPYSASFPFDYTARIYRVIGPSLSLYWMESGIPAAEDSVLTDYLDNGDYEWNLEVTDEFGNSALSLRSKFQVSHL